MALREFKDSQGVAWTVWSIAEDAVHPRTRNEDLLRDYAFGWLCFESATGEKRRLLDYPETWAELSDRELEKLCLMARSAAVGRGPERAEGESRGEPLPEDTSGAPADEQVMRATESNERRRRGEQGPEPRPRGRPGEESKEGESSADG